MKMDYLKDAKFGTAPNLSYIKEFQAWFNIIRSHGISDAVITAKEIVGLIEKVKAAATGGSR